LIHLTFLIKGDFREHWPNGNCTILFNDGAHYHGDVVKGVMHGQGKLSQICAHQDPEGSSASDLSVVYDGQFENGKKQG
jgi:hypothetical protein